MAWRLALALQTLRKQINTSFPDRGRTFDGSIGDEAHATRDSDHNPWVKGSGGVGIVTAIDITHDPENGCDAQAIADQIIASRDIRVKYIIHNGRMARAYWRPGIPAWTWAAYRGTSAHEHHVHISVQPDPKLYDSGEKWRISDNMKAAGRDDLHAADR